MVMDRAYESNQTRQLALALGFTPVVPPLATRVVPWEYDKELYKRRNEVERLFPAMEGLSPHLLSPREARRSLPGLHPIRSHLRCISVNRP